MGEPIEVRAEIVFPRHDHFSRGRGCRRADVRDEVCDRHIALVSDRRDLLGRQVDVNSLRSVRFLRMILAAGNSLTRISDEPSDRIDSQPRQIVRPAPKRREIPAVDWYGLRFL